MKKNKLMRLASGLLVGTLLTTCAISGTFAKYTTQDSAGDSARVAKFGVEVLVDGSLFEESYKDAPTTETNTITVASVDSADVVAPGTNNADGAFTFSITGKPEVDVKVTVTAKYNEDVFLKAGTYNDLTTGAQDDTFTLNDDYYPVKYSLYNKGTLVEGNLTMKGLVAKLNALSTAKVDANEDLGNMFGDYEIKWAWAFAENDKADTILGDLAAGTPSAGANLVDGTDYNLDVDLELTIDVTQID